MTNEEAKRIIEVLLFTSSRPVSIKELTDVLEDVDSKLIRGLLNELKSEYEQSGKPVAVAEIAGGFQFKTDQYYAPWIRKLNRQDKQSHLRMPSLETLAIIAYRQPVTKSEIEVIRGVSIDGVLHTLLERELIRTAGKKESPGRPILYATTNEFLKHFGLNSLNDLPQLKEFQESDIRFGERKEIESEKGEADGSGLAA